MNNYFTSLTDAFEDFEEKGKIKIGFENESVYKGDTKRKKQRSVELSRNDSNSEETVLLGRENFRITVFLPMIDHLLTALQKRLKAYDVVSGKFGFRSKMPSVNGDQLRDAAERLVKTYPEDLNTSFPEEIVHFQVYMNEPESDMGQREKGESKGTFIASRMLQTMKCKVLFQTCTFVYAFTYHFLSQTVLDRGLYMFNLTVQYRYFGIALHHAN